MLHLHATVKTVAVSLLGRQCCERSPNPMRCTGARAPSAAYAVVLSGGYEDKDEGDFVEYSGQGGRDSNKNWVSAAGGLYIALSIVLRAA